MPPASRPSATSASSCRCGSDKPASVDPRRSPAPRRDSRPHQTASRPSCPGREFLLSDPAPPAAPLRLQLRDFRNFERLDWPLPAGSLVLFGPNGAGKSSLVEALYLAATTRSFRAARPETLARFGCDAFSVRLEVGEHPRHTLELGWSAAAGRRRALDGREGALGEHLRQLPLLLWWQGEAQVVSGAPEARRRFFDRGTVHLRPGHLAELTQFGRALAEKRALLARSTKGTRSDARGLVDWNRLLARHGAAVVEARRATIASVAGELGELTRAVDASLPPIALRYLPSPAAALEGEEALATELERASASEIRAARALLGAQRDEVEILWGGRPAREVASAGERKTIGLLLLAAQARRLRAAEREPALLIDDADAELDTARLERIFAGFDTLSRLIVTSNRPELWRFATKLEPVDVRELSWRPVTDPGLDR